MSSIHRFANLVLVALVATSACQPALSAPVPVEGEYVCDGCHGFITVTRKSANAYRVRWVVSGGSCAGNEILHGTARHVDGVLEVAHKIGKRQCLARFAVSSGEALATDTCFSPEDERDSTCAVIGIYSSRSK